MKTIAKGRGRKLKTEQFPELSMALEYAFGELDVSEGGGGGLESHQGRIQDLSEGGSY